MKKGVAPLAARPLTNRPGCWLAVLLGYGTVGVAVQCRSHLISAEDLHFDATVLGTGLAGASFVSRLFFAQTNHVDPVDRDVVLGDEIVDDLVGPLAAQLFVVLP